MKNAVDDAMKASASRQSKVASEADWKFRQTAGQFARANYSISGELTGAQLTRCSEEGYEVQDVRGSVAALVAQATGRSGFGVSVSGRLGLVCQSCAAAFEMPVDSRSSIFVARDAAELASWEDESFESIEVNEKTSALELVEDELLLAVPYVPRCAPCEAAADSGSPRVFEFN
jgi:uncharacterized protein